ncbi:unnamed protein product [Colias eurytheme]|nr:unnamed protein product [Colias eurytheme]
MNDSADHLDFRKVLELLSRSRERTHYFRRMQERAEKVQFLYDLLNSKVGPGELKRWLRHQDDDQPPGIPRTDLEGLIENELKNALALKSSALMDRPVVQKRGKNDFLVMKARVSDPFVTVVPNDIYYNIEKKCVNWLDDCNAKGIKAKLLQKIKSPFK